MNVIAIDVSKSTLDILYGESPKLALALKIDNSPQSLNQFLTTRSELNPKNDLVIMESTGDYFRTPAIFFLNHGFKVKILNPILTKEVTRATIRKIKTDKKDAEKIMKLGLEGEGNEINLEELNNPAKELLRLSHFLTKLKTQLKLKLQSVQLRDIAGKESEQELMGLIERMQDIVKRLDSKAIESQNEQVKFIDSIPGLSKKLSQIIVAEFGDISQFKDANALVAYAGLDPKISQSGKSLNHHGRLTKRGPAMLRYALYLAARVAWRHDQDLYNYYEKKRKEGRSFTEATCMIARKLLHRIYVVVKEQRFYRLCQVNKLDFS